MRPRTVDSRENHLCGSRRTIQRRNVHRDRNFATLLPVFDWIFGTFHLPKDQWPKRYGVPEPVGDSYLAQMVFPFRRRGVAMAERSGDGAVR